MPPVHGGVAQLQAWSRALTQGHLGALARVTAHKLAACLGQRFHGARHQVVQVRLGLGFQAVGDHRSGQRRRGGCTHRMAVLHQCIAPFRSLAGKISKAVLSDVSLLARGRSREQCTPRAFGFL